MPNDHWRLTSTATVPGLPYNKRVEWVIQGLPPPEPLEPSEYSLILGETTDAGFRDIAFDGPVHFNNGPMRIEHTDKVSFRGDVTVYVQNKLPANKTRIFGALRGNPPVENEYTYGVTNPSGGDIPVGTLNNIFRAKYDGNGDEYRINIDPLHVRVPLPANTTHLTFGVDGTNPYYCINNNCAAANRFPYPANVPMILTDNLLTSAQTTDLIVTSGSIGGRVTVETTGSRNIRVDLAGGHLTYHWANFVNNDIGKDPYVTQGGFDGLTSAAMAKYERNGVVNGNVRNDVLALYAGGNIVLQQSNDNRIFTAQLFANNPGRTVTTTGSGNGSRILVGVASTNVFWNRDGNSGVKALGGTWFADFRKPSAPGIGLFDANGNQILQGGGGGGGGGPVITNLPKMLWLETNI